MKQLMQYVKRSTVMLGVGLASIIGVAIWVKQYLAIHNIIVHERTNPAIVSISQPVVKELPMDKLLNDQVLNLQVTPKTSYADQVRARSGDGVFAPNVPDVVVTDTKVGQRVLISWHDQSNQLLYDTVKIYRANTETSPGDLITTITAGTTDSYYDTTVINNQTYYYTIQTSQTTAEGVITSKLSPVYSVVVTDSLAPQPPQAITVIPANSNSKQLVVQWQNDPHDSILEHRIYRSEVAGEVGKVIATVPSQSSEWTDTTLQPDTIYYYTVSAVDAAGNESSIALPIAPYGNTVPFIATTPAL